MFKRALKACPKCGGPYPCIDHYFVVHDFAKAVSQLNLTLENAHRNGSAAHGRREAAYVPNPFGCPSDAGLATQWRKEQLEDARRLDESSNQLFGEAYRCFYDEFPFAKKA